MATPYQQTDAEGVCTTEVDSGGGVLRTAEEEGAVGANSQIISIAAQDAGFFIAFEISPGDAAWNAGDLITRLEVLSGSTDLEATQLSLLRVKSCSWVFVLTETISTQLVAGVHEHTVELPKDLDSGDDPLHPDGPEAGDDFLVRYRIANNHADQSRDLEFVPSQIIDTPFGVIKLARPIEVNPCDAKPIECIAI